MSIQALPPSTTRVLGSSQALTTPASLIKELIDNAIDARATSIDVILSANTLDKIEVRDNGHGIATEDLDALGRHGHTSKLRTFEELRTVGRLSLGFRGEALASAVTLGDVTVTTRTEGEPVAVHVKLKSTGGAASQSSASHPVGTTVCVSNFLSNFPVRKQTSLKDAPKTISKVKDILQSYALARLHVRLSLKILKTGKGNWSFVPRPKDGIKEAVMQVAGKEVASQCMEKMSPCEDAGVSIDNDATSVADFSDYQHRASLHPSLVIRAFLSRADADFCKIKGGQHASIDSRPISCLRGSLKKVVASYKQHIRAIASMTGQEIPKEPFLYLSIICPIDSYDANIEPAKDDVLFEDEDALLTVAEKLFKSVYALPNLQERETTDERLEFESGMNQGSVMEICSDTLDGGMMIEIPTPKMTPYAGGKRKWGYNMSQEHYEEGIPSDMSEQALDVQVSPSLGTDHADIQNTLNPWLIAKLNAPAGRPQPSVLSTPRQERYPVSHIFATPPASNNELLVTEDMPGLLTDSRSTRPFGKPQSVQSHIETCMNHQESGSSDNSRDDPRENDDLQQIRDILQVESPIRTKSKGPHPTAFMTAASMPIGTPWSPPLTQERPPGKVSRGFMKPFIPPKRTVGHIDVGARTAKQPLPRLAPPSISLQEIPRLDLSTWGGGHVDDALDFERRKAKVTRRLREELRYSENEVDLAKRKQDQHPNMAIQEAAITGLETRINGIQSEEIMGPEKMARSALPDGDPRAYLMRRQKSMTAYLSGPLHGTKMKRAKTMLLPLETIPNSANMHAVAYKMPFDTVSIAKSIQSLAGVDEYTKSGSRYEGLQMAGPDYEHVEALLNALMKKWAEHAPAALQNI